MNDCEIPGGVYLCQVRESVSCGACCGLYNVMDPSRENLTALLERRTRRFAAVNCRNLDTVLSYQKWVADTEPQVRPLPEFHHCPFIGLIGREMFRPGCLLHPLGNDGLDLRGLSDYGGLACRSYFCPTHEKLAAGIKRSIRSAARDWYEYGLMITEAGLIQAVLDAACRSEISEDADPERDVDVIWKWMDIKQTWPYRAQPTLGLIHYFFNDRLYDRPPVNYGVIGANPSKYDTLFQELSSSFASIHELREAEAMVSDLLRRMSSTLAPRIFRSFSSTNASLADSSG